MCQVGWSGLMLRSNQGEGGMGWNKRPERILYFGWGEGELPRAASSPSAANPKQFRLLFTRVVHKSCSQEKEVFEFIGIHSKGWPFVHECFNRSGHCSWPYTTPTSNQRPPIRRQLLFPCQHPSIPFMLHFQGEASWEVWHPLPVLSPPSSDPSLVNSSLSLPSRLRLPPKTAHQTAQHSFNSQVCSEG